MRRVIPHAKGSLDKRGDALGRPDVAQESVRLGALFQQAHQLGFLLGIQPGHSTRWHAVNQGLGASFARSLEPLTHRARRDAQRVRYRAAAPPGLGERPGAEPSPFVQLLTGRCNASSHNS
jgi:hypothetical protein